MRKVIVLALLGFCLLIFYNFQMTKKLLENKNDHKKWRQLSRVYWWYPSMGQSLEEVGKLIQGDAKFTGTAYKAIEFFNIRDLQFIKSIAIKGKNVLKQNYNDPNNWKGVARLLVLTNSQQEFAEGIDKVYQILHGEDITNIEGMFFALSNLRLQNNQSLVKRIYECLERQASDISLLLEFCTIMTQANPNVPQWKKRVIRILTFQVQRKLNSPETWKNLHDRLVEYYSDPEHLALAAGCYSYYEILSFGISRESHHLCPTIEQLRIKDLHWIAKIADIKTIESQERIELFTLIYQKAKNREKWQKKALANLANFLKYNLDNPETWSYIAQKLELIGKEDIADGFQKVSLLLTNKLHPKKPLDTLDEARRSLKHLAIQNKNFESKLRAKLVSITRKALQKDSLNQDLWYSLFSLSNEDKHHSHIAKFAFGIYWILTDKKFSKPIGVNIIDSIYHFQLEGDEEFLNTAFSKLLNRKVKQTTLLVICDLGIKNRIKYNLWQARFIDTLALQIKENLNDPTSWKKGTDKLVDQASYAIASGCNAIYEILTSGMPKETRHIPNVIRRFEICDASWIAKIASNEFIDDEQRFELFALAHTHKTGKADWSKNILSLSTKFLTDLNSPSQWRKVAQNLEKVGETKLSLRCRLLEKILRHDFKIVDDPDKLVRNIGETLQELKINNKSFEIKLQRIIEKKYKELLQIDKENPKNWLNLSSVLSWNNIRSSMSLGCRNISKLIQNQDYQDNYIVDTLENLEVKDPKFIEALIEKTIEKSDRMLQRKLSSYLFYLTPEKANWTVSYSKIYKSNEFTLEVYLLDRSKSLKRKLCSYDFVEVPKGEYWIGAHPEEPFFNSRHTSRRELVNLNYALYIGKTEVTNEFYSTMIKIYHLFENQELAYWNKSYIQEMQKNMDSDQYPVSKITWEEAHQFCSELTRHVYCTKKQLRLNKNNQVFNLPTSYEWEIAARYHCEYPFWLEERDLLKEAYDKVNIKNNDDNRAHWKEFPLWGQILNGYAVYRNSPSSVLQKVKTKKPNGLGLYDTLGNLEEWCLEKSPNNKGHMIRGGSWASSISSCRLSVTGYANQASKGVGFRMVLVEKNK